MTTFGNRLQVLMKHNNVTQQELANKLNVRRGSVSNWVTDRRCPDSDTLVKIANYFDVTVDYLLGRNDETIRKPKLDEGIKTIAARRIGPVEDLSDEAIDKINEYIEFIRMQQNKK